MFIAKCVPTDSLGDGFAAIDPNSKTAQTKSDFIKSLAQSDSHRRLRALFERKFTPASLISDYNGPPLSCARFKANPDFNRYRDVVCIDQSAVQLSSDQYIHANWVHGYKDFNSYILTQGRKIALHSRLLLSGPLEGTTAHFWQLVWETCSPTIVMLTKIVENGTPKCHQYWPSNSAHSRKPVSNQMRRDTLGQLVMQAPPFEIRLLDEQFVDQGLYAMCDLEISNRSEPDVAPLRCKHYLYLGWPDFDVPKEAGNFLLFLGAVNSSHQEVSSRMKLQTAAGTCPPFLKQPPKIVHCSAGIGRTGTYVAIDVNCALVKDCGQVDVVGSLQRLRRQRAATVQVDKQFAFVHQALRYFIDQNSVDLDSTPQ
ncbi:Tyrosine-protein phosphatase non-receptor type 9 [Cichlidogyrus casuarinus]|uniref:protein-tyrosine-phosphatase n=1 Tax=Cichlidogyrus casuarinus TaxID=1844966 RepID=A0ABD2QFF7_9PLAT